MYLQPQPLWDLSAVTVIATDGKMMVGDGLSIEDGGLICSIQKVKVRRLKDGRIFGLAGTPFDLDNVERWLNEGGDMPDVDKEYFNLLVLERNGRAYAYNGRGDRTEELLPAAVGSGTDLAVGAMEAGASPVAAVKIACKRHNGCGGKITTLRIGK